MKKPAGFSLVEVALSLGIIGFALVAILALVPVGLRSGRDSVDATRTSLIAQDVVNRVRASLDSNDSTSQFYFSPYASEIASFFFYTLDGARTSNGARTGELLKVTYPTDKPQYYANVKTPSDFYRAKVTVGTFDQSASYSPYDPRKVVTGTVPNLLCATVEIRWPVNTQDGSIMGSSNKATYSFFLRKP